MEPQREEQPMVIPNFVRDLVGNQAIQIEMLQLRIAELEQQLHKKEQ